ncbi:MAG: YkgJ family cysteine cluster protein [Planctomycetes bacterium]|nr:YkgJ family cysteine cluster protein [Planctomycetota bacterium]
MENPAANDDLVFIVRQARASDRVLAELHQLYQRLDQQLATTDWMCKKCGKCCDFINYGHRLYATTAELALLTQSPPPNTAAAQAGRCPYQVNSICTAYDRRTLGCRVFSCNADHAHIESAIYERLHAQIRNLHERHCLPYMYAELTTATRQMAHAGKGSTNGLPNLRDER